MTPEWDNKNWLQLESQRGAGHELNSSLPLPPSLTHCSNIIIAWIHNLSVSSLVYDVNPHDVRAWWELKGLPYMVVMISEACKALLWRRDNSWLQREREGGGGWRGGSSSCRTTSEPTGRELYPHSSSDRGQSWLQSCQPASHSRESDAGLFIGRLCMGRLQFLSRRSHLTNLLRLSCPGNAFLSAFYDAHVCFLFSCKPMPW